jgi:hypothetical protein
MSSFAAASTIPVTNKVAHANSRKSLRIRVITSPMRTAPCTARRARIGRRHDGDTSNLAHNGRRLDWFPRPTLFSLLCFRSVPNFNGALNLIAHQLDCLKKLRFGDRLHVGGFLIAILFSRRLRVVGVRIRQRRRNGISTLAFYSQACREMAMCPFRTHALQQTAVLFDHLVGAREQQR